MRFDYRAKDRPGSGYGMSRGTRRGMSGLEGHEKSSLPKVVGADVDETKHGGERLRSPWRFLIGRLGR